MLELTDNELAAVVKALRANLAQHLFWSITPGHLIRAEMKDQFPAHRGFVHALAQAYAKALMIAKNRESIEHEFTELHGLSPAAWDLLDATDRANDWDEMPEHNHKPWECPLCEELATIL